VDRNATGIYNICGKDALNIIEIVQQVADHYGLDKRLINPCEQCHPQPARQAPAPHPHAH
jgi:dTDP-4-dehydrorhamnose reductase